MTKLERNWVFIGNASALISGFIYGAIKYFFQVETEWGVRPHFLQPWVLYFHLILSPFLIFIIGLIWQDHIWKKVKSNHQNMRRSGLVLIWMFFTMVWSGYLLQTGSSLIWKKLILFLHLSSSLLWSLVFLYHFFRGREFKRPLR